MSNETKINRRTFNDIAALVLREAQQEALNEAARRNALANLYEKTSRKYEAISQRAAAGAAEVVAGMIALQIEQAETRAF